MSHSHDRAHLARPLEAREVASDEKCPTWGFPHRLGRGASHPCVCQPRHCLSASRLRNGRGASHPCVCQPRHCLSASRLRMVGRVPAPALPVGLAPSHGWALDPLARRHALPTRQPVRTSGTKQPDTRRAMAGLQTRAHGARLLMSLVGYVHPGVPQSELEGPSVSESESTSVDSRAIVTRILLFAARNKTGAQHLCQLGTSYQ
mmetsp:Transcript_42272/g.111289  ORF Transcript_42272/g.111289 Transcript_42272/m.111289 type:complete len:204 (+) Transcript_42272:593-1204(+)